MKAIKGNASIGIHREKEREIESTEQYMFVPCSRENLYW